MAIEVLDSVCSNCRWNDCMTESSVNVFAFFLPIHGSIWSILLFRLLFGFAEKEKEQASSDSNKWMKEWINERIVPWAQCIRNWGAFWRSKWNEKKDGQWRPLWIFFFSQPPLGKSVFIITWMLCIDRRRTTCSIDLYITDCCYRYISRNFMEQRARVLFCYIQNIFKYAVIKMSLNKS